MSADANQTGGTSGSGIAWLLAAVPTGCYRPVGLVPQGLEWGLYRAVVR